MTVGPSPEIGLLPGSAVNAMSVGQSSYFPSPFVRGRNMGESLTSVDVFGAPSRQLALVRSRHGLGLELRAGDVAPSIHGPLQ